MPDLLAHFLSAFFAVFDEVRGAGQTILAEDERTLIDLMTIEDPDLLPPKPFRTRVARSSDAWVEVFATLAADLTARKPTIMEFGQTDEIIEAVRIELGDGLVPGLFEFILGDGLAQAIELFWRMAWSDVVVKAALAYLVDANTVGEPLVSLAQDSERRTVPVGGRQRKRFNQDPGPDSRTRA